jgi:outer membrane protein OmpA-like peptidoglycan-associated protein
MQNHQSSYKRWSWIVALALALILLWMLITGRGPSSTCCSASVDTAAPAAEIMPAAAPKAEAFGFTAAADEFTSNGDGSNISWLSQAGGLKALLAGGDALQIQGDDKSVVLRGTVDTDAIRQQKGTEVQAFFGTAVTVDNQLLVKASEPEPVAVMPPPTAKLYFDSGKTALPADYDNTLDPIVAWLNTHPEAKAVVSGFHDPSGNQATNEALAYKRAKVVQTGLIAAGIDVMRIEFRKPESPDNGGDMAEARRVEVSVE